MTVYSPSFNVADFELRGRANPFLNTQQLTAVSEIVQRVPAQIDWVAQLLGWNGREYWTSLGSSVDEKRQLLGGSFGVYNSFIYPEILEVRNWENSVIVRDSPYLEEGQEAIVGNSRYIITSITKEKDSLVLKFEDLPKQFYTDIALNQQLRVSSQNALPKPFFRPEVGVSGDAAFLCETKGGSLVLYPEYDTSKTTPYVYNTFFAGSRYYFNLPVTFALNEQVYIPSSYDFPSLRWYIDIPCNAKEINPGLAGTLSYQGNSLVVGIKEWSNPSDWFEEDLLKYFKGVWGNKGGPLPFHFAFDSLSLHGFNPEKSVFLGTLEREVSFDTLLNFVYQQTTDISPLPPPLIEPSQVWWNSQTGSFSIHSRDSLNCGPWAEVQYPESLEEGPIPDFVFPDVSSFYSYSGDFSEGSVVRIIDCSGLGPSNNILGLVQTLTQDAEAIFFKPSEGEGWIPVEFIYGSELQFNLDALKLPSAVKVTLLNSSGLSGAGTNYKVENLKINITGEYSTTLMKSGGSGDWYLSPPSEMRYIGNTRLFKSSEDYDNPVEGEMFWDFSENDPLSRTASIFYYNNWVYNGITDEWELKGNWVNVNNETSLLSPPPEVVDFGAILVYLNGDLLTEGKTAVNDDFQVTYSVDPMSGSFIFKYMPVTYDGITQFPKITISDSLTTSFVVDITDIVFSGVQYYASPNVADSETLLRVWKSVPLYCVNDKSEQTRLSYPSGLIADENNGPADTNWERYFVKLPPAYGRNNTEWQRVNRICQNFAYWGSPVLPEDMSCPSKKETPRIYDEVILLNDDPSLPVVIYSEPYLYSAIFAEYGASEDYNNAAILPAFDDPYDAFSEGEIIAYDALHDRRADTDSQVGQGYGDWKGSYFRADECTALSGFLVSDILNESLESISPPIWDSSIYKIPQTCLLDEDSGRVDANHFKVGYAVFCADLSAAEEAVFTFG